jgi:hypothetical protein
VGSPPFFALLLCAVAWRAVVAALVWRDARRRGLTYREGLRWVLVSLVDARRYWWGARLEVMPAGEAEALLGRAAQEHDLTRVTDVRCPLCGCQIADALAVSERGALTVPRRGAACSQCDFRLDACRHCRHFLPAGPPYAGLAVPGRAGGDFTHGRCSRYREVQSVRETHPHVARRLEDMGYEYLPVPKRVLDSFFPLEGCTSFSLDPKRLRRSEVPWLTPQRTALIRLHQRLYG